MDSHRGTDWPTSIGALCAFYRCLPQEIMACTLGQFNTAVDAMNKHREQEAKAMDD